jgi:hypothetical protein
VWFEDPNRPILIFKARWPQTLEGVCGHLEQAGLRVEGR